MGSVVGTLGGENCPGAVNANTVQGSHFVVRKRYSPEETAKLAHVHAGFVTSRHWTA